MFKPKLGNCTTNQCKDILFTDTRGLYDATLNPDGWNGGSNPNNSTVDEAIITIKLPNASPVDLDVTNAVVNATILNYQTAFSLGTYSTTDVLSSGKFPNGIYEFTYKITVGLDVYTSSYKTYIFCQTQCCVDKLIADIPNRLNDINYINNVEMANTFLLAASKSAFSCGKFSIVDNLVKQAEKVCKFYNKTCC